MAAGLPSPITRVRTALGWSQSELAVRAGVPRTSVSAIEGGRLTPAVTTALALARALDCTIEELFGDGAIRSDTIASEWAWPPRCDPARYWEAEIGGRNRLVPVESGTTSSTPHDGVFSSGAAHDRGEDLAGSTLVMATCDPAAGLLATEYARASGLRLVTIPRTGAQALDLLRHGRVHVAGIHRASAEHPERNRESVLRELGAGFRLIRAADWRSGLAVAGGRRRLEVRATCASARTWALREPGSAARELLDDLCDTRRPRGRIVPSHAAVADAVRAGWADAGVCVELVAAEAGIGFLPVQIESLDLCLAASFASDRRARALLRVLRTRSYRRLVAELPGYDARDTGAVVDA
jgi:molybdate-binding protein/DNA-binding XRE family transcriptional regulator